MKNLLIALMCAVGFGCAVDQVVQVKGFHWVRTITIESFQEVTESAWEVPEGGMVLGQEERVHHQETYRCFGPYLSWGKLKIGMHDCKRDVKQQWYTYKIHRWIPVRDEVARGAGRSPLWPDVSLAEGEREGPRKEILSVTVAVPSNGLVAYECGADQWNALIEGGWYRARVYDKAVHALLERVQAESAET